MGHCSIRRSILSAVLLCGVVVWSGAAGAQEGGADDGESEVNARAELDEANRLAGMNALTRSIPHYEKAIKAAPKQYPSAQFNLANVWQAKQNWAKALLHFQAYLAVGEDPATRKEAQQEIDRVKARVWNKKLATLNVDIEPEAGASIYVDGFLLAEGSDLEGLELLPGTYSIRGDVRDHKPVTETVEIVISDTEKSLEMRPEKRTFFGRASIDVSEEGASIALIPKDLANPNGPGSKITREAPMEEPVELATGTWLLKVTKDNFHQWVRYIQIQRDKETSVQVRLDEKLPAEIR
jgi:tetratricopeptide (TPR) repeat protein